MSYKSNVTAQQLVEKLLRYFSDARSAGFDTDNMPLVRVGAGTAGSQSALLKVKDLPQIGKDAIGLSQETFCPEVIQIVLETSTIANVALMTMANVGKLLNETLGIGASKVEIYMSANGNTVGEEDIVSGNLKAELWADLKWRQTTGQ